jgi:hypothetical protein
MIYLVCVLLITHNSEANAPFLNYALNLFRAEATDSAACSSCENNVLAGIVKVRQDIAVAKTKAVTAHQYAVAMEAVEAENEAAFDEALAKAMRTVINELVDTPFDEFVKSAVIAARRSTAVISTAASAAHCSSSSSSSRGNASTAASASISDNTTGVGLGVKRERDANAADTVTPKRSKTVTAAAVSGGSSSSSNSSI